MPASRADHATLAVFQCVFLPATGAFELRGFGAVGNVFLQGPDNPVLPGIDGFGFELEIVDQVNDKR